MIAGITSNFPRTSIAECMGKTIDLLTGALIKLGINKLLETDLLDKSEKLTDLGWLLLDMDLEPHFG